MARSPNVVVIVADQLRADAVGAFGAERARTPHLDALAADGMTFTNAFVQHPVCSPSRASFLTGWYPHTAGHRTLDALLRPEEPNFLRTFRDQGYRVVWAGDRGDTFAPGATELSADEHGFTRPPAGSHWGGEPYERGRRRPEITGVGADDPLWDRLFYGGEVLDDAVGFDEAAVRTAESWLSDAHEQPWLLFVPLLAPHCPFEVPQPWFSLHDRAAQPAPVPPPSGNAPAYLSAIRDKHGLARATPEIWQEVAAVYHGMVSRLDDHVGRVRAAVAATGAAEDTVFAFFSDHGEYLGDFGVIEKWPSAMHACVTRDPLILSGGPVPAGRTSDALVELVDVFPSLLDLAGIRATHSHYGRSLRPLFDDPDAEHRAYAFTEGGFLAEEEPRMERGAFPYDLKGELQHENPRLAGKAFAARDRDWTYVWRLYEGPELYDRRADPDETRNLSGSPRHAAVEDRMRTAILSWLAATTDVLPPNRDPRRPAVNLPAPGQAGSPRSAPRTSASLRTSSQAG
ncbi:sulfatase-like hydrolase/transferase [Nonomuraea sp. NPDC050022]|uniref:sulfatase-like hydrolase/transferase n=1 Tax=Nonomuraea sp. NPDC050022 TaxID=3364358 RepID=UPI0037B8B83A